MEFSQPSLYCCGIRNYSAPGGVYSHMAKVGELLKDLAACGNTVVVVTHDPELIEHSCDYVLYIENGKPGYIKKVK